MSSDKTFAGVFLVAIVVVLVNSCAVLLQRKPLDQYSRPAVRLRQSQYPAEAQVEGETLDAHLRRSDINWPHYASAMSDNTMPLVWWVDSYIRHVTPFLEAEQRGAAPLKVKNRPYQLPDPDTIDCSRPEFASVLTGARRAKPRRIYDTVPFGWDIDMLEIRFYELEDVVDRFFVAEATRTQSGASKPLMFAKHRDTRFARWSDRINYTAWNPPGNFKKVLVNKKKDWWIEKKLRQIGFNQVRAYNGDDRDALAVSYDVDMIPSGFFLWHLKHCEIINEVLPIRVRLATFWNSLDQCQVDCSPGRISQAFGISQQREMKTYDHRPSRAHVHQGCHGVHINRYGGAASLIMKQFSVVENSIPILPGNDSANTRLWVAQNPQKAHRDRMVDGSILGRTRTPGVHTDFWSSHWDCEGGRFFLPWVVASNPARYPHLVHPDFDTSLLPSGNKTETQHFKIY